jgi:hypothetical protein
VLFIGREPRGDEDGIGGWDYIDGMIEKFSTGNFNVNRDPFWRRVLKNKNRFCIFPRQIFLWYHHIDLQNQMIVLLFYKTAQERLRQLPKKLCKLTENVKPYSLNIASSILLQDTE